MRTLALLTSLLVLGACDGGRLGPETDDPDTTAPGEVTGRGPDCTSPVPHVIDGRFTGWDGPGDVEHEWTCRWIYPGVYAWMYVALFNRTLYFLNDWHLNQDGPIDPECFNLFYFNLEGSVFEIRVYGDQHTEVLQDGAPYPGAAAGATTFSTSPELPIVPHTIFEFALTLPRLGAFSMCELDPRTTNSCDEPDLLVQEPTILKGTLSDDGTIDATGEVGGPYVTAASPLSVSTGDLVTVHGLSFDAAGGAAFVDGERAEVMSWGDREVRLRVPRVPSGARKLVLLNAASQSPAVTLQVTCLADCAGRVCGEDGCGGSCGTCAGLQQVCDQGTCACQPDCQGKECGPDGCDGGCGVCGASAVCDDGSCRCLPDCLGRVCGADGCGGTCGGCAAGLTCQDGACVCVPKCQGRQCGDDGCGGTCGACAPGQPCVDGDCVCVPQCEGKECGGNGCGSVCGTCAPGFGCDDGACVCEPDCQGKQCGTNGCGGSCGACGTDDACVAGQCVCVPQCEGKECGDNACGGLCGQCPIGQECTKIGLCAAP